MKDRINLNFDLEERDWEDVNKLINLIIEDASKNKASDIHLNPSKEGLNVRYRIDGVMREVTTFTPEVYSPLIKKIKERASMDVETTARAQDGKLSHEFGTKLLDVRISTLPSFFGENTVMRILDKSSIVLELDKMDFSEYILKSYKELLKNPYGMIVITGPTGCGKTTTGYASLRELASPKVNILTVEDPIEYIIDNTVQTRINKEEGISFPVAMRHIMRQDPDIIYISEIRDVESAKLVHQMAITGHLVITFLHTEDAVSAIPRLIDCGIEPFLISSALQGILAQRLLRRVCNECKESYSPGNQELALLHQENLLRDSGEIMLYRGKGCKKCFNTGFLGRTAIHEIIIVDDEIKDLLSSGISPCDLEKLIRVQVKKKGVLTIKQDGLKKAIEGKTTISEVLRVCGEKRGK